MSISSTYKNLILSTSVVFSYLFIEWIYNQHLLILLSYDHINPDDFEFTETFGKAIASIGLNLIINSLFKRFNFWRFIIGFFVGFAGLTFLFNYAVNSFPNEFRYSSYYSMLYRKDVINHNDTLEILKFSNDKTWYEKDLIISQFVYVLKDQQWHDFEKKIKEPVSQKIDTLNKNRSQYYKNYKKFDDSYDKILKAWSKYQGANAQYLVYGKSYRGNAQQKFIQKVGLPPNLSFAEFIKKSAPEYERYANTKLFEGSSEVNLAPIYLKDLPQKMNEISFNHYLDNKILSISTQMAPEVNNIRDNKKSFDSLAILVIPPISLCLSLFSIILNILILISKWTYHILRIKKINFGIYSIVLVMTSLLFIFSIGYTRTTLTETNNYWNNIRELNHLEHPVLFGMFSIGLKIEPILCLTNEEPKFIKSFTNYFYKKENI